MDLSTLVIVVVALVSLAWLAFLFVPGIRRGAGDEVPPNYRPYLNDADMESRRLDRTLAVALTLSTFLAVSLPIYYLGESRRQAQAGEGFSEAAIERGRHIYEVEFRCVTCHGPGGVGGSAAFVEPRSGISTSWAAPSLNDIFYRYDEDEIRYWIVYGRPNTPMPAWGLDGGGPMNSQQVDEVLAYLRGIQLDQSEVVAQVEQKLQSERNRLQGAEDSIRSLINEQEQRIEEIRRAPEQLPIVEELLTSLREAIDEGTSGGIDSDGDGLSDASEQRITEIMAEVAQQLEGGEPQPAGQQTEQEEEAEEGQEDARTTGQATTSTSTPAGGGQTTTTAPVGGEGGQATTTTTPEGGAAPSGELALTLDPTNPTSTTAEGGEAVPDLQAALDARSELESRLTALQVTVDRFDTLLQQAREGLQFLERSLEEKRYAFDYQQVAEESFDGDTERAERAALLFNAYCARCHTSGYNAGVAFTLEAGSGAMGPSLWQGRSVVQFPDAEDHVDFVVQGSENAVGYGVNGVGTGRMPGFGPMLPLEDIELIVQFERGL
ncbi:MAG: c-type cytochrome [Actinomycetota bacterium]|nr:c-type cytochrome [Actinomycetota bacterium]